MIISNESKKNILYNLKTKNIAENILKEIGVNLPNLASLEAHIENQNLHISRPDKYKSVLPNIVQIPPQTKWELQDDNIKYIDYEPFYSKEVSFKHLIDSIGSHFEALKGKKIAVQLSGGLDSSIIIGLLKYFGFEPLLIGMRNNRFEFRTERMIQDLISEKFQKTIYVNDEDFLPFSNLKACPKHELPNSTSLFFSSEKAMADLCQKEGVDIVLNGMAMDSIFCFPANEKYVDQWQPWMFDNNWFREHIYAPLGIEFVPAFNSKEVINNIWNLRRNEGEDNPKTWARTTFKDFIPSQLVSHTYKASHAGILIDGIKSSKNELDSLYKTLFKHYNDKSFSSKEFALLFTNVVDDDKLLKLIMGRVSYAVWLTGSIGID